MLENIFPKLQSKTYRITSPRSWNYNCVAWAAGDAATRWWPSEDDRDQWPVNAPRVESLDAFRAAFATLGYRAANAADYVQGTEKVAIFANAEGVPLHMARQLPNGRWTSKLGALEDIEHDLHDLEGDEYGQVVLVMERPFPR
jgi:hypothetical protein